MRAVFEMVPDDVLVDIIEAEAVDWFVAMVEFSV